MAALHRLGLRLFVAECFPPMNASGNILIMQDQRYDILAKEDKLYSNLWLYILLAFYSAIVVLDSFISTAQNGVCLSLKSLSAGTKEKLTESKRISNVLGSRFTKEKIRISQKRKWREYYFQFYKLNLFNLKKILKSLLC